MGQAGGARVPEALAYVSCCIDGDRVDPKLWTKYFGVDPDISVVKGNRFRTPSGRLSRAPGRTGVWGCSSKRAVFADELDPHFRFLISLLDLPRADLPALLAESGARMRFFCFWSNYTGDRVPLISEGICTIVAACAAVIDIDEYPQRHRFVHEDGTEEEVWI